MIDYLQAIIYALLHKNIKEIKTYKSTRSIITKLYCKESISHWPSGTFFFFPVKTLPNPPNSFFNHTRVHRDSVARPYIHISVKSSAMLSLIFFTHDLHILFLCQCLFHSFEVKSAMQSLLSFWSIKDTSRFLRKRDSWWQSGSVH